jgi:hypothetical protein
MKKVAITVPLTLVVSLEDAAALLPLIGKGKLYETEGYGDSKRWVMSDRTCEFTLIDAEEFEVRTNSYLALEKCKDLAEQRWLKACQEVDEKNAEIKRLTERLTDRELEPDEIERMIKVRREAGL